MLRIFWAFLVFTPIFGGVWNVGTYNKFYKGEATIFNVHKIEMIILSYLRKFNIDFRHFGLI